MKYILFPHGGSGNHGCEAIVRTTTKMLEGKYVLLFSNKIEEDQKYIGANLTQTMVPQTKLKKNSKSYISALVKARFLRQPDAYDVAAFYPVISQCDTNTVLMSIGGDNYCYGDNEHIYLVNRHARKRGAKTVLWGCSVEPEDITEKMMKDLCAYDLIVARESITYESLKKINPNVILHPDPAFTLPVGHGFLPEGVGKKPCIGINASPMIMGKETFPGITIRNYQCLIENILNKTECDLLLIPHVVWSHNDDRKPLTELYHRYEKTGRVYMVQDQNCTQLKHVISRCSIFVGARTHATIAAYSTCVPTLVVGYSVKARGIAKDLFDTDQNYVLSVQELKKESDLWNSFQWVYQRKYDIRKQLHEIMPDYIRRSVSAGEVLKERFTI